MSSLGLMRVPTVSLRHKEEIIVAGSSRKTLIYLFIYIYVYFLLICNCLNFFLGGGHTTFVDLLKCVLVLLLSLLWRSS